MAHRKNLAVRLFGAAHWIAGLVREPLNRLVVGSERPSKDVLGIRECVLREPDRTVFGRCADLDDALARIDGMTGTVSQRFEEAYAVGLLHHGRLHG
jgi:hypothetical protein